MHTIRRRRLSKLMDHAWFLWTSGDANLEFYFDKRFACPTRLKNCRKLASKMTRTSRGKLKLRSQVAGDMAVRFALCRGRLQVGSHTWNNFGSLSLRTIFAIPIIPMFFFQPPCAKRNAVSVRLMAQMEQSGTQRTIPSSLSSSSLSWQFSVAEVGWGCCKTLRNQKQPNPHDKRSHFLHDGLRMFHDVSTYTCDSLQWIVDETSISAKHCLWIGWFRGPCHQRVVP